MNLIIEDLINGTLKGTREFFKFEWTGLPKNSQEAAQWGRWFDEKFDSKESTMKFLLADTSKFLMGAVGGEGTVSGCKNPAPQCQKSRKRPAMPPRWIRSAAVCVSLLEGYRLSRVEQKCEADW